LKIFKINKIKEKIKIWLFKNELNQLNDLIIKQNKINSIVIHNEELIKSFLATCETGYDLGISKYHKNWCVFVRQGKGHGQDFVKFIDLSDMVIEDIKHFEKQLELINRNRNEKYYHIDAPIGIKDYFIFK